MAIESANYISELQDQLPAGSDPANELDNHQRLTKQVLKKSFASVSGPVTSTHVHLSNVILQATAATDTVPFYASGTSGATTPLTSYGRTVIGLSDASALRANLNLDSLYAGKAGATFAGGVVATGGLTVSGASPSITLTDTSTSTNRYVTSAGGSIGFTNTAGAFVMSVVNDGHATVTGNLTIGGNFYAGGTVTGSSDATLKTNVQTSEGLNQVLKLKGRTFDWISTGNPDRGVIAQEVQSAGLSELVLVNPNTGTLTVNYSGLSAVFIEAFRDLAKELDTTRHSMTMQIMALQERLAALEAR